MNYFTIFALGENFDVEAYLNKSSLNFDKVWRKGDPRGCPEFFQDKYPTSGVEKYLGCGRELHIHKQDKIATEFLESNEEALKELAQFPGVDTFIIGLHYHIELTPDVCVLSMSASSRLMYISLCIGIEPTFYVDLERKDFDTEAAPLLN